MTDEKWHAYDCGKVEGKGEAALQGKAVWQRQSDMTLARNIMKAKQQVKWEAKQQFTLSQKQDGGNAMLYKVKEHEWQRQSNITLSK